MFSAFNSLFIVLHNETESCIEFMSKIKNIIICIAFCIRLRLMEPRTIEMGIVNMNLIFMHRWHFKENLLPVTSVQSFIHCQAYKNLYYFCDRIISLRSAKNILQVYVHVYKFVS